ncbi:MAG TPA: hypothetical protein VK789_10325 [Bryobacteraceae bacterium]|nr:hypothetical protein [Bryobacteraceae bacterium]
MRNTASGNASSENRSAREAYGRQFSFPGGDRTQAKHLRYFYYRRTDGPASVFGHGHAENFQRLGTYFLCVCSSKIFVERKQRVRFEFSESPAELLLNTVNLMKESAAIYFQLATAEVPVCSEEEMKLENPVLRFIQKTPAHQAEIGDVFFVSPAPNLTPCLSADDVQARLADMLFFFVAESESCIAEPEDFPQHAVTRRL